MLPDDTTNALALTFCFYYKKNEMSQCVNIRKEWLLGLSPRSGFVQQLKVDEVQKNLKAETHGGQWKKFKPASLFSPKNSGNKLFDNAQLRWMNTNKCIAYSTNRMNLYVEAPEAFIWEQALANEVEIIRKENVPQF